MWPSFAKTLGRRQGVDPPLPVRRPPPARPRGTRCDPLPRVGLSSAIQENCHEACIHWPDRSSGRSVRIDRDGADRQGHPWTDRKSTRLNSSHLVISYAVFCLKKKTKN